ncbi:MAG: hypothetical protein IT452_03225 [Planctomycetia bacterium]|nr:hypothetical protein [Planctomycetia bacterium]
MLRELLLAAGLGHFLVLAASFQVGHALLVILFLFLALAYLGVAAWHLVE